MAGRYKKTKRSASSSTARTAETERVLPLNKMIANRDKALEKAQTLKAKGFTDEALAMLERAEYWQAKIEGR